MDNKVHPHQNQPPFYSQTGQNVNAPAPSYQYQMQPGQAGQPMQTFQPPEGTSYPSAGQCPQPSMQTWAAPLPGQYPPEPGQTQAPCYTMSYPPAPPRPPPEQQQQQQQQVVVFNNAASPINIVESRSFCGQMTLACFVFWCCSPLFGLIAFILAAVASNRAVSDPKQAKQLGDASYGVSIAGIVVTVVITAIVVGVTVSGVNRAYGYDSSLSCSTGYRYNYVCYNYRTYYSSSSSCYYGTYDYSTGYCYYDTYRATTPACNYYYNYQCYTYYTYTSSSSSCYSTYNGYPVYYYYGYYCYYS